VLFKRRHKEPTGRKLRNWLWPERGVNRAFNYWGHRLARLPGSAHAIAAGFACGAALSFTPFLGFHFLLAMGLAFIVRGNYLASVIGTAVGNPWTFPFIFAITYKVGVTITGTTVSGELPAFEWSMLREHFMDTFDTFFLPLMVGSIPLVIVVWFLVYFPLRTVLRRYKDRRAQRREARERAKQLESNNAE